MPRMLIFRPPVLPALPETSTPSTSLRASARLETRFFFSSSPLITLMLAGASVIFCSNPDALTTTSCSAIGSLAWALPIKALARVMALAREVRGRAFSIGKLRAAGCLIFNGADSN
ncbi:hypothetical protein FQZ97_1127020 [compost metagenome]